MTTTSKTDLTNDVSVLAKLSLLMDEVLPMSEVEREAFCLSLEERDAALAAALRKLLRAHRAAQEEAFLESTLSLELLTGDREQADTAAADEGQPLVLGPYRLLQKIGAGGMSSVWLAERQFETFTRRLAIKCLPAFFGSQSLRERLLQEAAMLSQLVHPGIAQFFDAGLTERDEPYIALELVDGEPITTFCDARKLDVKARVKLFVEVCDAVAFLHRHSVIHRDLKPSNILVNRDGRPKLLDFGIAKVIDTAPSDLTRASVAAFTPEYAAPEQVEGGTITTATDVYALGVLLYKLLTGARPYGRNLSAIEFASAVVNTEPSKPSTLFWPTGGSASQEAVRVAAERGATVKQLRAGLQDDLDNIVLKCLEKDRDRRYATVDALRADLIAHLERRPIAARSRSKLYIARKFVSRHRGGVAASAVVISALVGALGFGAWQARQTQIEAENSKRVLSFLQTLIAEANPNNSGVETLTVLNLLERAPQVAKRQFPDDPNMQLQVLSPIDTILQDLGALQPHATVKAELIRLSDASTSSDPVKGAEHRIAYAGTLARLGKREEVDVLLKDAMTALENSGKKSSSLYAEALMTKAESHMLRREVDAGIKLALDAHRQMSAIEPRDIDRRTRSAYRAVSILMADFRFVDASAIVSADLSAEHIAREPRANLRLQYRMASAAVTAGAGDPHAAAKQYDSIVDETKKLFGGRYDGYLTSLWLAARTDVDTGNYERALARFHEAESIIRRDEKANTISLSLVNGLAAIAAVQAQQGKLSEATATMSAAESLRKLEGRRGGTVFWQAAYQVALANGDLAAAEAALDSWIAVFPPTMPETDMNKVRVAIERANIARAKRDHARAKPLYESAIAQFEKQVGVRHFQTVRAKMAYASVLSEINEATTALPVAQAGAAQLAESLGAEHPLALQASFLCGQIEQKAGVTSGAARAQSATASYQKLMQRRIEDSLVLLH
jgi:serine/threonine protein kinase